MWSRPCSVTLELKWTRNGWLLVFRVRFRI
jgi:hypothetical protein